MSVEVIVEPEAEPQIEPVNPVDQAVAAVAAIEAASAAAQIDGMVLGSLVARIDSLAQEVAALRTDNGIASAAIADLNARLAQEQQAHQDALEKAVERVEEAAIVDEPVEPVGEVELEPPPAETAVVKRKRKWA